MIEAMRQHIADLCERHDLVCSWCQDPAEAWAVREFEEICIPPIKSVISYATALHEIGHIKGRHQLSQDVMVRERWAWKWAVATPLIWTPARERDRQRCLSIAARQQDKVE